MKVTGILSYGLDVPSLEVGSKFYRDFGLQVEQRRNDLVIKCEGRDMDQAILTEGPTKKLRRVDFAVDPGSLPDWQRNLEAQSVKLVDPPDATDGETISFYDPHGILVCLRDQTLAAWRAADPLDAASNFGDEIRRVDQARWLSVSPTARPRRLSHMIMFVPDIDAAERFYAVCLGLKLSDRMPGAVSFMNCGPGDHHVFGFIKSTHIGLHHSSWEVPSIDELVTGAYNMAELGHREGWGLGRHTLGSNLFHYIRDPWGSWIEYTSDLDYITDNWVAKDWDAPPATWCPTVHDGFLVNHEPRM